MFDDLPVSRFKGYHFTGAEKLRILEAYEACTEYGQKSALVRRVGMSQSRIAEWGRARQEGRLSELDTGQGRRDRGRMNQHQRGELDRLRRENARLRAELEKSQSAVDILGKASALLESLAKGAAPERDPGPPAHPEPPRPQDRQRPGQ